MTRSRPAESAAPATSTRDLDTSLRAARRQLLMGAAGIMLSAGAFGVVYGLAARNAGFSVAEALAMSVFVLAGASQFAAIGLVAHGTPWAAIVVLTALLNARHLLYSAALSPWLRERPAAERAAMAHVLTDETFAMSLAHFQRLGRLDVPGYWIAAAFVCVPWILATVVGVVGGEAIPDPNRLGLDVVFPAAMAGLGVALVVGRRELVAALAGAAVGVVVGLVFGVSWGVVAGGILGPVAGLAVRDSAQGAGSAVAAEPAQIGDLTRPTESTVGRHSDRPIGSER